MEDNAETPARHGDLTRRVLAWMLLLSIVPLLIMAGQGYHCGKQAIVEKTNDHLLSIVNSRSALVSTWFDQRFSELDVVASSPSVARCCAHFADLSEEEIDHEVTAMLRSVLNRVKAYDEIAVLGRDGTVIADVARSESRSFTDPAAPFLETVKNAEGFQMQRPERDGAGTVVMRIGRRIREGGTHTGMILAKLDLTKGLDPLLQSRDGMGQSGKVYLVWLDRIALSWASSVKHPKFAQIFTEPFSTGETIALRFAPPAAVVTNGPAQVESLAYVDFRGHNVWARFTRVVPFDIVLVVEQDTPEALAWLHKLLWRVAATAVVTTIALVLVSLWISRRLGEPLRVLARVAQQVRSGATDERVGPLHGAEAEEVRKAFNQMLDELAAKQRELVRTATLASIGELSSSIVHEMRNPLSSIKMNLQSLKREVEADPANRELAGIADAQVRRLERMLDDLLQYGRPIEVRPEPVAFEDMLKSVGAVVAEQARAKQVAINPQDEMLKAKLLVDPEQMCRALTNLLVNAIQASPSGGTVTVRARKDTLWGHVGFIDVIDSGEGLSDEAKDRVFSPFFTTKETGAGLGLANVKKIVELHGGTVTAANAAGAGAVFTIRLPLAQGTAA
jgi:signal transduction histidine kinase